ncbi:hypothetical protein [Streptomyces sp. NBC_01013]|uniref:hypothetical protein n=1 Tax=Streptomyces sp. NBC_01013 TaxID=2903718 RepID=UPI00386E6AC3|nr:hypothetical protein OG538_05725 [Streptomyces sp. NBC_01013]
MSVSGEEGGRRSDERFGFRIARRGYDRDQVEAYITRLREGAAPAGSVAFDLVRRGYARGRVDEVIAQLHREAGSPGRP